MAKATAAETTPKIVDIKTASDSFNGIVKLFENKSIVGKGGFWVESSRKEIVTDYMTLEEAHAQFDKFVNDTQF